MNRGKQKSSGMPLSVQLVVDFPQYVRCAFPKPFYNELLSFRAYTVGRQYIWWNLLRAFLRQSLPWRLHPWQILTEEFTKQQAREAGGRWGLGRNDALGKNSAEEPNFQEIPMAAFFAPYLWGIKIRIESPASQRSFISFQEGKASINKTEESCPVSSTLGTAKNMPYGVSLFLGGKWKKGRGNGWGAV